MSDQVPICSPETGAAILKAAKNPEIAKQANDLTLARDFAIIIAEAIRFIQSGGLVDGISSAAAAVTADSAKKPINSDAANIVSLTSTMVSSASKLTKVVNMSPARAISTVAVVQFAKVLALLKLGNFNKCHQAIAGLVVAGGTAALTASSIPVTMGLSAIKLLPDALALSAGAMDYYQQCIVKKQKEEI